MTRPTHPTRPTCEPSNQDARPVRIVEIVGLAGSGKSTTCARLRESYMKDPISFHVARAKIPSAIIRAGRWFVGNRDARGLRDPSGGWTGLYLAVHMQAMVSDLLSRPRDHGETLFLDQGPIFNCVSAEGSAKRGEVHEWVPRRMRQLLMENLHFLDAIIVLNADLPILLDRIDAREDQHRIKGAEDESARQFLEDYRARYESILNEIQDRRGIEPFRLDTGVEGPEEIVESIRSKFSLPSLQSSSSTKRPHGR